jgi:hypothetical protein
MEKEVTQIRINSHPVGIIGLKQVMEELARDHSGLSDEEIGTEVLKRIAEQNYIPHRARDLYIEAFAREFRKFLGQPGEEKSPEGLHIAVLGPGCAQCSQMEIDVRDVLSEMKLPGELLHVTDVRDIGRYGVMGVPALVISGRVVCVGTMPHKNKIREWLSEAALLVRKE